ncbi:thioesterase II family protein [Streptomyces venezuelae]|uniref:Thioesterase n=1 Tax=Streptomyces venezuelae TaxID=54571 RepID=A0A5P2C895_STRVZ|nr:alpha/beta fold hydrolase [Streptomyces venezuelae]QES38793.1 thioesterase [Streptomyces venezuelae]
MSVSPPPHPSDPWIRRFRPRPEADVRLICFPHAGGSASYFHPLAQSPTLLPDTEVLAVQYPGRQDRRRERLLDGVPEMADRIAEALLPFDDRPMAFFGHSMGAVLAFEVAQRLREGATGEPRALFVSGRRAPSVHRRGTVHLLNDADLVGELRRAGGTDPRFLDDEELLAEIIPVVRSDYRAVELYQWAPTSPLSCPVTALVGDRDPQAPVDEVEAWRQHTDGPFDLKVFSGGHFYLNTHQRGVADVISEALADSAQRPATARGNAR